MDEKILKRIRRIYVAIGRNDDADLANYPASISSGPKGTLVYQDFSGGRSQVVLEDILTNLIRNVASFHDHLREWGRRNGVSEDEIHNFLKDSHDFCIVTDLWNNDKHGYPRERDGWTRRAPHLINVNSILQIGGAPGSVSVFQSSVRDGKSIFSEKGGGTAEVIVTGDVVDKDGQSMGDVRRIIDSAIQVCEAAVERFVKN